MGFHTKMIYDGKAQGLFAPEAFDQFMTSEFPAQLGQESITVHVCTHIQGPIKVYSILPFNVTVPYEYINGHAVVGASARLERNLDLVINTILASARLK